MDNRKTALKEALLEALRYAVLLGIGFLIALVSELPETETTLLIAGLLRFVDKAIHEYDATKLKGLLPF